ncbi:MAG: peptidylprolyl isomerase [Clostridia bacterium]|nr:peptidylprolyl isomerase [Clostridia bacterium]
MKKIVFRSLIFLAAAAVLFSLCSCSQPDVEKIKDEEVYSLEFDKLLQNTAPEKGDKIAVMETSMGTIKLRFFPKIAPKAVENFITLSERGYYNGVTFHRVMDGFMIQGGDPTATGHGGESCWGKEFEDEFSKYLFNFRGALSMANAGANTNGSQFFINQNNGYSDENWELIEDRYGIDSDVIELYKQMGGGAPWLDGHHTVFGQVIEGMDVVDAIAAVDVNQSSKPYEDVTIISITIEEYNG